MFCVYRRKLNARKDEAEGAYQNILGRLAGYEDVSENALNQVYMGVNLNRNIIKFSVYFGIYSHNFTAYRKD